MWLREYHVENETWQSIIICVSKAGSKCDNSGSINILFNEEDFTSGNYEAT